MNEDDSLLTVREVSGYVRVGEESIRRWLREGKLVGVNLGRGAGWRVRRQDLTALVDDHRTQPNTVPRGAVSDNGDEAPANARLEVEVTCVTREPLQNPHTGVTHLGNASRRWTRSEIISAIDAGTHVFYTETPEGRTEVAICDGPFCRYLRTRGDGQWNDALLALEECAE